MKKSILIAAVLILTSISAFAQNTYNLVIFSEDAEPFYAYVNGIRQNDKPETNIRVTGLNSENLNVRVQFENKALPQLKQNLYPEKGFEHTVNIRRNKKQEIKMQYFGQVPIDQAPQGTASTIQFHTDEHPMESANVSSNTSVNTVNTGANTPVNNDGTTITTTETSTQVNSNPENVSINVNIAGVGMNMNVNVPDAKGTGMTTTSSTTVTSTSSSSSSYSSSGTGTTKTKPTGSSASTQPVTGGCATPMTSASYDQMKKSVESKPFSDTKMSTAKVATKNACLTAAQIKGICALFSMDDDKLEYAKYAYSYCVDKSSYYLVGEVFSFSTTNDELNKFLEKN